FSNTSTNADQYTWDFGDGSFSSEVNPVHTYLSAGTYTVKLTTTNACGSTATSKTVLTTVGTSEQAAPAFTVEIVPNPTAGDFIVKLLHSSGSADLHLQLIDPPGRVVRSIDVVLKPGVNSIPFDGSHLPKGIYQLIIRKEDSVYNYKLVIQ
ncbi:MAG: PKD domain-containing protein, partial [Bacteroidota bacterium]